VTRRKQALWLGGALVVLTALASYWWGTESEAQPTTVAQTGSTSLTTASQTPPAGPVGASSSQAPYSAAGLQTRQEQLALWRGRYERAEQMYASYRDATRYPYDSRPIAEHPDQVHPFAPISEDLQLRNSKGELVKGIHLRTTQERVFLSGAESVSFAVAAVDDSGNSLPLTLRSASAQSVPDTRTPITVIQTQVAFADDGSGRYTGRLTPSTQGFQSYAGTIRLLVEVASGSQQGVAQFDVIYSPDVPATWAGVREALEAGSLNFYVKANVRQAGRYVVSARVDDANGVPFALVQFNDEVAAGSREFRLQVFGALVLDKRPAFPLRLRDVDGFLLIPDKFPDRATMARQTGVVHTSARYALDRFSPAEWTSEERQRYLAEYAKDAETARRQIENLSVK